MLFEDLESRLYQLMSFPLKGKIKLDFDRDKKIFTLTIPIFHLGNKEIPFAVQKYIQSRRGITFRPHATSYHYSDEQNQILLMQELPFEWGFQPMLREQMIRFWEMAKHCHQMLIEIAAEEKLDLLKADGAN